MRIEVVHVDLVEMDDDRILRLADDMAFAAAALFFMKRCGSEDLGWDILRVCCERGCSAEPGCVLGNDADSRERMTEPTGRGPFSW